MRRVPGNLAIGLLALMRPDEFTDPVDQEAAAFILAESLWLWRKTLKTSKTRGSNG